MDTLTTTQRRIAMAAVKGKDTKPEMFVRRLVHRLGFRYRLHVRELPGKPDLVFVSRKKVIFVNGCFWHRHDCPKGRSTPTTRVEFWKEKFAKTMERDKRSLQQLDEQGWSVLVIWECQTGETRELETRITHFLDTQ